MRDTTAWTLGRIFEFLHGPASGGCNVITPANLQAILTVLVQASAAFWGGGVGGD